MKGKEFIQSIAQTIGVQHGTDPAVVVLTTHKNRLRQIFGVTAQNGCVLRIQIEKNGRKARMEIFFNGSTHTDTQSFEFTEKLPSMLLYIVRHGEGVHNVVKKQWEGSKLGLMVKKRLTASVVDASITQHGTLDAFIAGHYIAEDLQKHRPFGRVIFCASDLLRAQQTSLCVYHHLSRIGIVKLHLRLDQMFEQLVLEMVCKRSSDDDVCKHCGVPGQSIY
jgi:hypothetical protein